MIRFPRLITVLCVVLLAGASLVFVSRRNRHKPPERFIEADAGGHPLHMLVVGNSGPTIVLESGLPGGMGWQDVRRAVGGFATAITYDRAGIGKSPPGPLPRDARQIATELHAALHSARFAPPYILVGQSMGGPYVRVFAAMYPQDVAGLVLVDPSHAELVEPLEDLHAWFAAHHPQDWSRIEAVAAKASEGSGPMIISSAKAMEEFLDTLPSTRRDAVAGEFWSMFESAPKENLAPELSPGARDEFKVVNDTLRQAIAARPLPRVPTILLAAGQPMLYSEASASLTPGMRALHQFQKNWKMGDYQKWVDATPGTTLVIARRSGHNIQTESPQIVIDAIRKVIQVGLADDERTKLKNQ